MSPLETAEIMKPPGDDDEPHGEVEEALGEVVPLGPPPTLMVALLALESATKPPPPPPPGPCGWLLKAPQTPLLLPVPLPVLLPPAPPLALMVSVPTAPALPEA